MKIGTICPKCGSSVKMPVCYGTHGVVNLYRCLSCMKEYTPNEAALKELEEGKKK